MSDDPKCVAGCVPFYGGEKRHHKDCPYYPESLTKLNADRIEELEAKLAMAVSRLDKLAYWLDIDQELWDAFTVMEKSDHRHMQSEVQAIKDILS